MDSMDIEQQTDVTIDEAVIEPSTVEIHTDELDKAEQTANSGHGISLPIARIKRIIKQDDDVVQCSSAATVAIAAATELFVQYFSENAMIMARGEKRKKLNYSDFANAVVKIDQLEFLSDIVPRTTTLRKLIRDKTITASDLSDNQMQLFSKNGELATAKRAVNGTDGGNEEGQDYDDEDTAPEDDGDLSETISADSASDNENENETDSDDEFNVDNGMKDLPESLSLSTQETAQQSTADVTTDGL